MLASEGEDAHDLWVDRMRSLPTYVGSSTVEDPLDRPDAAVPSGDPGRADLPATLSTWGASI